MIDKPLVSVITPFYNTRPQFMEEAIGSVLKQSYDNWELLLIDDGSTDESTDVARRYAEKYPHKIRYLEHSGHQNRGASASRQLGLKHAKGEYVAFLDADDIWLSHKLEQQVAILITQPEAAMLYGNTQYWYGWTGNSADSQRDYLPDLGVELNTLIEPPTLISLFLRGKAAVPCICSLLVKREAVERIGGFEDSFPGMYDDQVFYAKICLESPVYVADACWDKYRQHPDSCCAMALNTEHAYSTRLNYLNWLTAYLSEREITDAGVWQAIQKELWLYRHYSAWPSLPAHIQHLVRRMKKWLLHLEERALPASIHRWLWVRE